jgi:hypothetical protein
MKTVFLGMFMQALVKDIKIANLNVKPRYRYITENKVLSNDKRMSRTYTALMDLRNGGLSATHTSFNYEWTSPDNVFLNAPTSTGCHGDFDEYAFFMREVFKVRGIR